MDYVPGPGEVMMADALTPGNARRGLPHLSRHGLAEAAEAAAIVSAAAEF